MNKAYKIAQSKLGLKEIKGAEHNPEIIEMFAAVGHDKIKDDETAWCAAFVGWCLKSAGLPYFYQPLPLAYRDYGTETKTPKVGDIAVLLNGHVGFLHSMDEKYIYVLGGNQNNEVSVMRFERNRLLSFRSVIDSQPSEPTREELKKQIEAKDGLILRLQAKLINLGDTINGLYKQSQREI